MTDTPELVRKDDPETLIVGTVEQVFGVSRVYDVRLDADGRLAFDHAGTDIDWNSQRTVLERGERLFLDENDNQLGESAVVIRHPDGRLEAPSWRAVPPAPAAEAGLSPLLWLSVRHVRRMTMQALQLVDGMLPVRVLPHETGALVEVGPPFACKADIQHVLDYARARGCSWINFDSEAPALDALPLFDWPRGAQ